VHPNPNPILPLSGFEVFRDELVAGDGGLGFGEVLARWEALTDEQRAPYDQRAWGMDRPEHTPAKKEALARAAAQ
jgi:hypothetical protein